MATPSAFRAFDEGVGAARRGIAESECPFDAKQNPAAYAAWRKGHFEESSRMAGNADQQTRKAEYLNRQQENLNKQRERLNAERRRPLYVMHEPSSDHLSRVVEEMKRLGPPIIRCLYTEDAIYALEGVHRLTACSYQFLQIGATLHCLRDVTNEQINEIIDKAYQFAWHCQSGAELIEAVEHTYGWIAYATYRRQVPGVGIWKHVQVFNAPAAWKFRMSKPYLDPEERLRWKEWELNENGNYNSTAAKYTATVFEKDGGWKITIKYGERVDWGTKVYTTAEEAMENAWIGVKKMRLDREQERRGGTNE